MPQKSCGVIVWTGSRSEPRFLLLRSSMHGHWEFAKGHVADGEDERQTALRELEEETGISGVELDESFRKEIYYKVATRLGRDDKTVVYFLGRAPDERLLLSDEHGGGGWFSLEEAFARLTFDNHVQLLRAVEERLRGGGGEKGG